MRFSPTLAALIFALAVALPSPSQASGKAMVLCPGGSYEGLAIDHEGYGCSATNFR